VELRWARRPASTSAASDFSAMAQGGCSGGGGGGGGGEASESRMTRRASRVVLVVWGFGRPPVHFNSGLTWQPSFYPTQNHLE
jgi:hypothetical protein